MRKEPWAHSCQDIVFWDHLAATLQESFLPNFLTDISKQVDEIIEINPDLSESEILTKVTRYMVEFLGALSASVRIYDPNTGQMLSFGSHPYQETSRKTQIPWRTP